MEKRGHIIVCGYGVVGENLVQHLGAKKSRIVIIESNPEKAERLRAEGYKVVEGDATKSSVLERAGIAKASAIAIVLDDDAKNMFSVITARDMRKDIYIVSRANDEFVKGKLADAGANYVVAPRITAAREIIKEIERTGRKDV
jgi:voltage-gated potassium channel Kch